MSGRADHDELVTTRVSPVLLRDQSGETPESWYAAYRYMDRMFAERRDHRSEEIASLDLSLLSYRMKYLMKCLLVLQRRYAETLDRYPNLRGLDGVTSIDEPIILSDPPRHAWAFFKRKGIWL